MADQNVKFRHKKSKKCKKHRKSESESSSDSEPKWVEAPSVKGDYKEETRFKAKQQRDDWMTISDYGPTFSSKELHAQSKKEREEKKPDRLQLDNPGQHERELNPYWRDGGKGLPEDSRHRKPQELNVPAASVGDGGVKWLRRAYQRAKEQAEEEGRSLEEVAAERWGSLEKLERLLASAEEKAKQNYSSSSNDYSSRSYDKKNFRRSYRHDDDHSRKDDTRQTPRFEKPSSDDRYKNERSERHYKRDNRSRGTSGWKVKSVKSEEVKKNFPQRKEENITLESNTEQDEHKFDKQMASTSTMNNEEHPEQSKKTAEMDLNRLGAKLVKAELMGNKDLVNEIRAQMESLRANSNKNSQEEKVVIRGPGKPRDNKRKTAETRNSDGKRRNYFADDDKYSLNKIFEKEKSRTAHDENFLFAKLASKGEKIDNDEDVYLGEGSKDRDSVGQATKELKRSSTLDNCQFCFESKKFAKYLMVAMATKVYLCVPRFVSLTEGHCFIVPMEHVIASTHVDEDVWEEIQYFKKALTRMFEAKNMDIVFFEMSRNLNSFSHMIIECVPLPRDVGDTAPIYFKKAILECETEWSNNKKVVDLSTKDVRKAVPKGLPYFAVNFGAEGGFAHVIEDERLFPRNFAQEIIGGMLDLEPHMWRKPPMESFDKQQDKAYEFISQWKSFDWTNG